MKKLLLATMILGTLNLFAQSMGAPGTSVATPAGTIGNSPTSSTTTTPSSTSNGANALVPENPNTSGQQRMEDTPGLNTGRINNGVINNGTNGINTTEPGTGGMGTGAGGISP
jgi:hypothetical protein